MKYLFRTAVAAFVSVAIFACSKGNDKPSAIDPRTGKHAADWAVAVTGGNHPTDYLAVPSSCYECHGKDLAGGISTVSCFTANRSGMACHPEGPSNHPTGWAAADSHGTAAKAASIGRNGMAHCQRCHGVNFTGTAHGPSCLNNAACHGAGKLSAHSPSPWLSKIGGRTHHNADATNAAACAACHTAGANSTRQPSPAAAAGTAPGCFNNTLCHGVEGHEPGWSAASLHGVAAKETAGGNKGFVSCTQCHGSAFNGGTSGQSCLSAAGCHGAAVAAPHPARPWLITGGVSHTTTDTSNASQCVPCHTNGANSTRAPRVGDPVGSSSCYNNTLCHGTIGHVAGWSAANQHGAEAKKAPAAATGFSSCRSCHGSSFNNGTASSCMTGLGCHGILVNAPHPAKPWTSSVAGTPTHTTTDTGNVAICAICHTGGANSDVKPPTPAVGTAGCFNNTLCHFHAVPYTAPNLHGTEAKKDLLVCKTCHGTGTNLFNGGTTTTACATCHTAAKAHPTDWHGAGTYSHRSAGNRANACAICHNVTSSTASPLAGAPSCFTATFTNGAGQNRTCHPSGPGNAPHNVPYINHNATGATNFTNCQGCHADVQNATVPPGCRNCHITSPVTASSGCTSCHGTPPNSTVYPNLAAAHAAHATASKVATTTLVCADCHTGLGSTTLDHYNRAKARTATGRANPVAFSNKALIIAGGGTASAFNDTNDQCTNTYCHGAKMPGGDATGSNRTPTWSAANYLTSSIADCGVCHGFPPTSASGHPTLATPTTFAQIGSLCAGCHSNLNASASSYATIFATKAQHIDGTLQAVSSHNFPYSGALHKGATGAANGTGCLSASCHTQGTSASPYPIAGAVGTRKPACRACHLNANPGTDPQCSDCHGSASNNGIALDAGRPNGSTFPNRGGGSDGHSRSNHRRTCTTCHLFTTGDIRHGWSNGAPRSTSAQVLPSLNWSPGSRAANTGTCNPSAGGFSGCHSSKTGWY